MKKIMTAVFAVFFVFISLTEYISYNTYCETLIYSGLSAFSIQKNNNETTKEYIQSLSDTASACNADIMYSTQDFTSDKPLCVLYKTNNTPDFFKGLNLENNGRLTDKKQCFSTKSEVQNFEAMPMGISAAVKDFTVFDISYMDKYDVSQCKIYTSEDKLSEITNALSEKGYNVTIQSLGVSGRSTDFTEPYILLSVLMCAAVILYALSQKSCYAVKRLNGYSTVSITADEIRKNIPLFLTLFAVIMLLNFGTVSLIFRNTLYTYFSYSAARLAGAFVLVVLIFILSISLTAAAESGKAVLYLKGKGQNKGVFNMLVVCKLIFLFMLVISISASSAALVSSYNTYLQTQGLSAEIKNMAATKIYQTEADLNDTNVSNDYEERANNFYNITVDKFDGILINSLNYQLAPDNVRSFAEYSGQRDICINKNYLVANPIHKSDGSEITAGDLREDMPNILIPENGEDEYTAVQKYKEIMFADVGVENINIIKYAAGEKINSYNSQTASSTLGLIKDPDIIVYNQKYMKNYMLSSLSVQSYLLKTTGENPYAELKPYIEQAGLENILLETPYISNTFSEAIGDKLSLLIYDSIGTVLYLISLLAISVFLAKIYIENYKNKIVVQKLCGISFFDVYKNYFMINLIIVFLLAVLLFAGSMLLGITYSVICYVLICVIDFIVFLLAERSITRKSVLSALKGE